MKNYLLIFTICFYCTYGWAQDGNTIQRYTGPIIDMHVHAYLDDNPMYGMNHPNSLKNEMYTAVKSMSEQQTKTFEIFKKHNVVKAVVSDGQRWKKDDRIIISRRSDLSPESIRKLYEAGEINAIGELAPFYDGIVATDSTLTAYFDLAEELQIPLGFHIMPGGPPGGIYYMGMDKVRVANADPKQLEEVLVKHPKLKIYIMHGGWPYLEDMKAMLYAHPQLYLDVSAINWVLPKKEFHSYLESLVNAGFGNRIMFGSDQMVWPEVIEIAINAVNSANLTIEQKADIFYNNAARLLGLDEETIKKHRKK